MMKKSRCVVFMAALFMLALGTMPLVSQQSWGAEGEFGPYELVPSWPQPMCGDGFQMGSTSGVWAVNPDRVFVFARGCLPEIEPSVLVPNRNASAYSLASSNPERHPRWDHILTVFNREGSLIESWEQHNALFVRPHRVLISPYDPQQNVWLVDDGAHSIYKFTHDGQRLLMALGEFGVSGNDETHFNRPTDIAWLPNGDFFVSDGYGNTRVVKFNKDGKFLLAWGQRGEAGRETRPGYFNTVHGIAIDANRRVYVVDRANSRIQIFDENGNYLDEWRDMARPYYIWISKDQHLFVSDGNTQKIAKFDLNGNLEYSWGTFGAFPGGFWGVHQFSVDSEGSLYTADVHVGRVQKFRPKRGADPARLVRR